jgi:peptide/nickel transport system substrate-binding protein
MHIDSRRWVLAAATTALVVAGCSPGDKTEPAEGAPPKAADSIIRIKDKGVTAKGGTVEVLGTVDWSSLDPANNYLIDSSEVGRLIYRTLTFVKDTPGEDLSVQPDLAESLGTSSDGGKTWTYKLREGLKFEDGKPITAADVKYGVQRSFAQDVYDEGATYMVDLLENKTDYAGPYTAPEKDLTSVETPDDRTLVFHFKGPQADADWILSQAYTAPVPKDADTKEAYADRPVSSGPYKIEKYTPDESLVLVRNDQWDPATDPNRPAYPDKFQFSTGSAADTNKRLLASKGPDAYATGLTLSMSEADAPKLDEPSVKPRFVNGPGPCVDYVAMNTETITDPDIRHAIALAIDRQAIQRLYGGDLFGSVADSIVPPTAAGFQAPDLGLKPQGDVEAAKKLLAGKAVPPLHMALDADAGLYKRVGDVVKANLKAAGVEVVVDVHKSDDYTAAIEGDNPPAISLEGWCADWPTPAAVVPSVFGPDPDGKTYGSNNITRYYDPTTAKEMQDLMSSSEAPPVVNTKLIDLANKIQTTAWPLLPTVLNNTPEVVGANVTNAGVSPLFGVFDLNTVAVKQ